MPVHTQKITRGKSKGKFNVRDNKGKKYNKKPMMKKKANAMVTAINISQGHVPGVKSRKRRK